VFAGLVPHVFSIWIQNCIYKEDELLGNEHFVISLSKWQPRLHAPEIDMMKERFAKLLLLLGTGNGSKAPSHQVVIIFVMEVIFIWYQVVIIQQQLV
jgi:hypothetical protein